MNARNTPEKRTDSAGPGLTPDDPMAEAGRKILRFHFQRMLQHEPGTREGRDPEALHDMRVATRRMRAAFRVFGPFFDPTVTRPHRRGLRLTAAVLGAVRDLDVLIGRLELTLLPLPVAEQASLEPLLSSWRKQRVAARGALLAYLDSRKYRRFVERFREFLESPGKGVLAEPEDTVAPTQVCHLAAVQVWQRYAAVRAYETVLPADPAANYEALPITTLHALRIECKRLRYTLEFFREVLPPAVTPLIELVVKAQDHLGDLHDADVAIGLIRDFMERRTRRAHRRQEEVDLSGADHLLRVKREEMARLLATFPPLWRDLSGLQFRRDLAHVLAEL